MRCDMLYSIQNYFKQHFIIFLGHSNWKSFKDFGKRVASHWTSEGKNVYTIIYTTIQSLKFGKIFFF